MLSEFKQAKSWNRFTMTNKSDFESDLVRTLIDSNGCFLKIKKNQSRKKRATDFFYFFSLFYINIFLFSYYLIYIVVNYFILYIILLLFK